MSIAQRIWTAVLSGFRRFTGAKQEVFQPSPALIALSPALVEPVPEVGPPPPCAVAPKPVVSDTEKKSRRRFAALRREIAESVADVCERVAAVSTDKLENKDMASADARSAVNDLWGCDFLYINDLIERTSGDGDYKFIDPQDQDVADMAEMHWPLDYGIVVRRDDGELFFSRIWTADPASLRGRVKIFPRRAVWHASMTIYPDGTWWADRVPAGLINNRWCFLDEGLSRTVKESGRGLLVNTRHSSAQTREELHDTIRVITSALLTERYNWHVALGAAGGPRVLLPTSAEGCLALFKDRDKPAERSRREALKHWVAHHYRESGDRNIAYVRDHLRGATEFDWMGFGCELFVSAYDLEKDEFFRNQAEEWRSARKHNRVRVKLKRRQPEVVV